MVPDTELIEAYLACPRCRGQLAVIQGYPVCRKCRSTWSVIDGVVLMMESEPSFFDEVTDAGDIDDEFVTLFRKNQEDILMDHIRPGMVICDIGCGRALQYRKPDDCTVIGIDPSLSSIKCNGNIDLRVLGSALNLPIASKTLDVVTCFYSIHHMVGKDRAETYQNVVNAFKEFSRVLKKDGNLFVFEVSPWRIYSILQDILWNQMRRRFPRKLDMYLWSSVALKKLAAESLHREEALYKVFHVPAFKMLHPFLVLPRIKVPRLFIPVDVCVYHWQ